MICRVATVQHNNSFQSNSPICSLISVPTAISPFRFSLAFTQTSAIAFHLASHLASSFQLPAPSVFQAIQSAFARKPIAAPSG